jgi:hypothetical protein
MTRRAWWLLALAVVLSAMAGGGVLGWQRYREWRERPDRKTVAQLQQDISALTDERDRLRARLDAGLQADRRARDLPEQSVRIGVPTTLTRTLIQRLVTGMADQVALEVRNISIRKQGSIRRVVQLGDYDLRLNVSRVRARITTGAPAVTFGRNRMALAVPVRLASGTGEAEVDFTWDGRNVSGLVCGDMTVKEVVTGAVTPINERVTGTLTFSTTGQHLVVTPRLSPLKLHLTVVPSEASWATVQRILDSRKGVCGMVLSRVDIRGALDRLLEKGFNVTIPTGKLRPVSLPVGLHSVLRVKGRAVPVSARAGTIAMTPEIIWLGAEVDIDTRGIVTAR